MLHDLLATLARSVLQMGCLHKAEYPVAAAGKSVPTVGGKEWMATGRTGKLAPRHVGARGGPPPRSGWEPESVMTLNGR